MITLNVGMERSSTSHSYSVGLLRSRCIRVLIASHSAGLRGGAERCVSELATALRADGRVEPIVTMPMRGELTRALEQSGVETRVMPAPTWLVDPSPAWPHDPLRAARRLKRLAAAVRAVPALERVAACGTARRGPVVDHRVADGRDRQHGAPAYRMSGGSTSSQPSTWASSTRSVNPTSQRLIDALSARVAVNSAAVAADTIRRRSRQRKLANIELGVEPPPVAANDVADGKLRRAGPRPQSPRERVRDGDSGDGSSAG